jgi:hypothetical protein
MRNRDAGVDSLERLKPTEAAFKFPAVRSLNGMRLMCLSIRAQRIQVARNAAYLRQSVFKEFVNDRR